MDEVTSETSETVADPSATARDVVCKRCGYNLRGLPHDGRCPECGAAVRYSTGEDWLRFSDAGWLWSLRRGALLMLWGCAIGIVVTSCVGASTASDPGGSELQAIGSVCASIVFLLGAWLLTAADPAGIGEHAYGTARGFVRFALPVGLGGQLLYFWAAAVRHQVHVLAMLQTAIVVAGLVGVAGTFALLYYLEKLCRRMPDPALAVLALFLRWAVTAVRGATLLFFGVAVALWIISYSTGPIVVGPSTNTGTITTTAPPSAPGGQPGTAAVPRMAWRFERQIPLFTRLAAITTIAGLLPDLAFICLLYMLGKRLKQQAEASQAIQRASLETGSPGNAGLSP